MKVEFFIPGIFKAKGRPRFNSKTGHAFTPKGTQSYEAIVRHYAEEAMGVKRLLDGPLHAEIDFVFPRPKSKKLERYHQSRPDMDNCLKTILDAMNSIVFKDDSLITECIVVKYLHKPLHIEHSLFADEVGVRVYVREITEEVKWEPAPKAPRKGKRGDYQRCH